MVRQMRCTLLKVSFSEGEALRGRQVGLGSPDVEVWRGFVSGVGCVVRWAGRLPR